MKRIKEPNGNYTIKDLTEKEYKVISTIIHKTYESARLNKESGLYDTNNNLSFSFDKEYFAAVINLDIFFYLNGI